MTAKLQPTPGPWIVAEDRVVVQRVPRLGTCLLADIRESPIPDDEANANAILISHAPMMLEAIRDTLRINGHIASLAEVHAALKAAGLL